MSQLANSRGLGGNGGDDGDDGGGLGGGLGGGGDGADGGGDGGNWHIDISVKFCQECNGSQYSQRL